MDRIYDWQRNANSLIGHTVRMVELWRGSKCIKEISLAKAEDMVCAGRAIVISSTQIKSKGKKATA